MVDDPEAHALNLTPRSSRRQADRTSFRDIVMATRETVIDAMAYELPVNVIEQTFPDFIESREDLRTSQFIKPASSLK
jgi:hypothetical protein